MFIHVLPPFLEPPLLTPTFPLVAQMFIHVLPTLHNSSTLAIQVQQNLLDEAQGN